MNRIEIDEDGDAVVVLYDGEHAPHLCGIGVLPDAGEEPECDVSAAVTLNLAGLDAHIAALQAVRQCMVEAARKLDDLCEAV